MSRSRSARLPQEPVEASIESLTQDGRGVAHIQGKAVFIHGALPGERVRFIYEQRQKHYDAGRVETILQASADRVAPACAHFGICGGCCLQHLHTTAQIQAKAQVLEDALTRIGKVRPEAYLPPLVADSWGYRRKARLGVKYVLKKGRLLIGFRERASNLVAELQSCPVLHPRLGERLGALNTLITQLSVRAQIPQIEWSMGDDSAALIVRILAPMTPADQAALLEFGQAHALAIYLQEGGPETVRAMDTPADLYYTLPDLGLRLAFAPLDFTQVNLALNRQLINHALMLLNPQPEQRVLDLFCGIGNFTLPLAQRAGAVVGVEGATGLITRARANAAAHGLDNCQFYPADLYGNLDTQPWLQTSFDQALLDPPRSGAMEILPLLPRLGVQRLLYISCYPATLARDAGVLVQQLGYRLIAAGVMDMFPHTAHVEALALFEHSG